MGYETKRHEVGRKNVTELIRGEEIITSTLQQGTAEYQDKRIAEAEPARCKGP